MLDRPAREPFRKSVPLLLVLALFAIVAIYGVWIITGSWSALPTHSRFLIAFLLLTSPLILGAAVQLQRHVRSTGLGGETAQRILLMTFVLAAWSYALLGIALRIIVSLLR